MLSIGYVNIQTSALDKIEQTYIGQLNSLNLLYEYKNIVEPDKFLEYSNEALLNNIVLLIIIDLFKIFFFNKITLYGNDIVVEIKLAYNDDNKILFVFFLISSK